jgi:formylglycine-generating enzyme required for sulfatase activity/transcriptional regulator with XRE-family HTH domain
MPNVGAPELVIFLIILLVLLGGGKIREVLRGLGSAIREMSQGRQGEKGAPPGRAGPASPAGSRPSPWEGALGELMEAVGEGVTLGTMLEALLRTHDISEYKLAQATGVDRSTINRLRKDETENPRKDTLLRLLRGFPDLDTRWREQFLATAGYPPVEPLPCQPGDPFKVYLSCHGNDLSVERSAAATVPRIMEAFFSVKVGDETWCPEDAETEVCHSDYLVMVQGWRWVSLRLDEHRAAQKSKVAALYFQKEGGPTRQQAVEDFLEEVGRKKWTLFDDTDVLALQVWQTLSNTAIREARKWRDRMSLQSIAALYLATQMLSGEETTLTALLRRQAADKGEMVAAEEKVPRQEPASRQRRRVRRLSLEPVMVRIPAGRFWMGTDRLTLELAGVKWEGWMERETPYRRIYLPEYEIGRYPVTNAEFARFIEDGGYQNPGHWTDAGWKSKEGRGWTQPRWWDAGKFNGPSQPVVGVSWYEALAYCNWLAAKTGTPYRLPSEAEWEKAARGTDGLLWPWGNRWDPDRCNTSEKGPGRTTSVGQYSPAGDSPYDVADMAGNVWEWMISLWGHWTGARVEPQFGYPYDPDDGRENLDAGDDMFRVMRGGSFGGYRDLARCAYRDWRFPDSVWFDIGFRVVVSPISPASVL